MKLEARHLSWNVGDSAILYDVSFSVARGEFLGVIGPNGSGKSSLMSVISGIRQPSSGIVLLDYCPLATLNRRDIACQLAFVEQQVDTSEDMTARQVVELGRIPHLGALSLWRLIDKNIVDQAMEDMDMAHCANRSWISLSGGERQRIQIARAIAQRPTLLLLDEPTNHLDIGHQLDLLVRIQHKCSHDKLTVIAALHDLNHAALFCDRILAMDQGRIIASGSPQEVLTPDLIAKLFHAKATVETTQDGALLIRYHPHMLPPQSASLLKSGNYSTAQ